MTEKDRARQLIKNAANASSTLEESVRELVRISAWALLGYSDFPTMWEKEVGFECPRLVLVWVVHVFREESVNSTADISLIVGKSKTAVYAVIKQLSSGMPAKDVRFNPAPLRTRARSTKHGHVGDDISQFGFRQWQLDALDVIARKASRTRSDIIRQMADDWLAERTHVWVDEVNTVKAAS